MEEQKPEKQVINLSERDINRLKLENEEGNLNLIKRKSNLARLEKIAEQDLHRKNFTKGIEVLKKHIETGKDANDEDIDELSMADLKIQLEERESQLKDDLPGKEMNLAIKKSRMEIEALEANIKVREKQIREGSITIQR